MPVRFSSITPMLYASLFPFLEATADGGGAHEAVEYVPDVSSSVGRHPMTLGGDVTPRPHCY